MVQESQNRNSVNGKRKQTSSQSLSTDVLDLALPKRQLQKTISLDDTTQLLFTGGHGNRNRGLPQNAKQHHLLKKVATFLTLPSLNSKRPMPSSRWGSGSNTIGSHAVLREREEGSHVITGPVHVARTDIVGDQRLRRKKAFRRKSSASVEPSFDSQVILYPSTKISIS